MMDWTDRHARYFLRLCSRHTLLYTEMVPAQAIWRGKAERFLAHHAAERPVAVQFGGADPRQLAYCARLAGQYGYDEVNLNVGCPSDRVQAGRFGACLMAEPDLVATLVRAMQAETALAVTVKTRIGIDDRDDYTDLARFAERVASAGCRTLIVHARKAWLKGLSPRENREIPPLRYDRVHRLKQEFPELEIILNGGVRDLDHAREQLRSVDGVMIGREAYRNPYLLADADELVFGVPTRIPDRHGLIEAFIPYLEEQLARGVRLSRMTRHIVGMFQGMPGARAWRHRLTEGASRSGAGIEVVREALTQVPRPVTAAA